MYDVARQCYDDIHIYYNPDFDTPERMSAGKVSDAALAHKSRMNGWND